MQGIYSIPDTNHVCKVSNVAVILWLKFVFHMMLFPTINMRTFVRVLFELCAQYSVWLFTIVP